MGGADYKNLLPGNSYIDVYNFSSPQRLAQYLNDVASDESKYYSYFRWKQDFASQETFWYFCVLCDKIKSASNDAKDNNKKELNKWWFDEGNCIQEEWDFNE